MERFSTSPLDMLSSLWRRRELIATLARRDIAGRYRGSFLGMSWSLFHPLVMLGVYTFVFGVVFGARWNAAGESKAEFALVLFAGLMVFNLFAEPVVRAPALIVSNANYVKKVVFPLEALPLVALLTALFHAAVSLAVWALFYIAFRGMPPPTAALLPLVVVPLMLLTLGVSWLLASLGVFLRDLTQFIGVAATALMFFSPVFYPLAAIPEQYRALLHLNPLTFAIESARDLLIWGRMPDPVLLAAYGASCAMVAWLGYAWFQATRREFADVV